MTSVTVVVPIFNEADSLPELVEQVLAVCDQHDYRVQVVLADDGSTDRSWEVISRLAAEHPRTLGIRLRRNFGKSAALSAGFDAAIYPLVVTMDGDLQDDPAELPRLLGEIDPEQGGQYDVVSGWKQVRHDPLSKTLPSRVFNWMVSRMTGVKLHDHNCGLKAYRREVLDEVTLYGELHRFVPVLAAARGFKVTELVVNHRPRKFGHSKYGASRFVKGLLDILTVRFITSYSHRPQHLLGGIGAVSLLLGMGGLGILAVRWVATRLIEVWPAAHLHETAALYYCLAMVMIGSQFLSMGLLAEMIAAKLSRREHTYSVAQTTDPQKQHAPDAPAAT